MVENRQLHPGAESLFAAVLHQAATKFRIVDKENELGIRLLSMFSGLDHYKRLYVHQVTEFTGAGAPFIILLLEKHQMIAKNLSSGMRYPVEIEEVEPVLIFSLPQDIGHVFIKEETLGDKVTDLLTKQDIDFEAYPQFSSNYYVTGDNPDMVKLHLPASLMKLLGKLKGLQIEINRKVGIVRTEKNLSEDVLLQLITIGHQVSAEV
ncbi:hypothetical protein H7F15_14500 [Pontibacter sp. Tf4]|uniref:hypothetical protein n=1 Tax=Pontibacter sp. Tf4 TaxID=2761620 RepID=UPI001625F936|nr:hypothetical protein [Pontibacter sp. Tf4]MBB6612257.1 hypothetical protein [Pontibacter sp. Tf4]